MKEGDPGYLKSASESDSALDDSTEYDTIDSDSDESPDIQEKVRQKAMEVSQDDTAKAGLLWLKSCLEDELEDREEEDEAVPIVPITEDCILAMERPSFISVLELIELSPPNDQEQYWRIPSRFSARNLSEKSKLLAQLAEDELDFSVLDLSLIMSKTKSEKVRKVKKVKKKKTWMPMRRTVDPDVVDRIHSAVAANKSGAEKKATPLKSKGKRVMVQNDSSSESNKESDKEDNKPIEPKSRSFIDSSDSSDDEQRKSPASSSKRKKRQVIKSDDSSGDEKSPLSSSADEVDNPSIQASSKKEKERASQQKRRVSTSSSDEGVIDPYPIQRVPSDTEEDVTQTTFNTTQEVSTTINTSQDASTTLDTTRRSRSRSRSRSRTRSISSSSSSSYRSRSSRSSLSSRSPSRSPVRSPVRSSSYLLSSNSNTPKRARSSPSPSKNGKKLKTIPSGSSSEDEPVLNVKKKSANLLISSDEEN